MPRHLEACCQPGCPLGTLSVVSILGTELTPNAVKTDLRGRIQLLLDGFLVKGVKTAHQIHDAGSVREGSLLILREQHHVVVPGTLEGFKVRWLPRERWDLGVLDRLIEHQL